MWQTHYDDIVRVIEAHYYLSVLDTIFPPGDVKPREETIVVPIVQAQQRELTGLEQEIEEIIERYIRPSILEDGGNIVLDHYDETSHTVYIQLQGACKTCHSSYVTLKNNVENTLIHFVPEVQTVQEVNNNRS